MIMCAYFDNSVIAIVRQEVGEPLDYQQPSRVYRNLLPNKTRGNLYDLYPASVAPGRPVLYQVYVDERQR